MWEGMCGWVCVYCVMCERELVVCVCALNVTINFSNRLDSKSIEYTGPPI